MLVHIERKRRCFYAKDININWSFDRLAHLAESFLGANLAVGDLIVVDNPSGTKRKMLQKTKDGYLIFYARFDDKKGTFVPLSEHNGKVKITGEVL